MTQIVQQHVELLMDGKASRGRLLVHMLKLIHLYGADHIKEALDTVITNGKFDATQPEKKGHDVIFIGLTATQLKTLERALVFHTDKVVVDGRRNFVLAPASLKDKTAARGAERLADINVLLAQFQEQYSPQSLCSVIA